MVLKSQDRRSSRLLAGLAPSALTAVAYCLVGFISLELSYLVDGALLVWPPAGVAFAATTLWGPKAAVGVAVGAFVLRMIGANVLHDPSGLEHALLASGAVAIAAAVQPLIGVWVLRKFRAFPFARIRARSIGLFQLLGGAFAGACGASLATASFLALGRLTTAELPLAWALRFCQEALGIIAIAPVIILFVRAPAGERLRRSAPVAIAAVLSLTVATLMLAIDAGAERRSQTAELQQLTAALGERIGDTIKIGENAIGGLAGAFEAPAERNLHDFNAVAKRVLAFGLGFQAMEWVPRVPSTGRADYEARMRDQWARDFTIFELSNGKPVPAAPRANYFPIGFVYPLEGNEGALGFDLGSNPDRKLALDAAQTSGSAVATPGVRLVQNGKMGVLLFVPVFGANPKDGQAGDTLKGFALGTFAVSSLLDVAFGGQDRRLVKYWIIDETDPARPELLDASTSEPPAPFQRPGQLSRNFAYGNPALGAKSTIAFAGRTWSLRVAPTEAYVAERQSPRSFLILLGSLILTSLVSAVVIVQTDEQRQLVADREKALRDQKFALDQHAIVSITDVEGRIVYANEKFCDTSGYPRDLLIGKSHSIVRSDQHDAAFFQELWTTALSGKVWTGEICNRSASGELYWLKSTIVPLRDREGRINQFINISTDVTRAKQLEQDLRRSEERLAMALSASLTGLWDYDPISDKAVYSDTWYSMLGYQPGEIPQTGAAFFSLLHPDDARVYDEAFEAHRTGKKPLIEAEFRLRRKDGSWTWIASIGKAIERDANGEPTRIIGVHRDVTQRRENEAQLAAARDAADRANQAKSDFLATMSHEIRTPMNGVIGMSILLEDTPLTPEQTHYVQTIRKSGEALVELIGDILDFARLEAGRVEIERREFSPVSLVENVLEILEPVAAKARLRLDMDRSGVRIARALGDPTRLRQVLLNLTGNAVKFTPSGRVTIRLIGLSPERLRIEVEDTGIGVPEAQRERLFQAFSQADASITSKYGGTGLGLAICKRIMDAMGGAIGFESREGAGSLFWFEAPVGRVAEDASDAPAVRRRVALVCGQPDRAAALNVLASCGLNVVAPEAAELMFVDGADPEACLQAAARAPDAPVFVFGAEKAPRHGLPGRRIGGALTPSRIRRALLELTHEASTPVAATSAGAPAGRALDILVVEDTVTNQEVLGGILSRLGHSVDIASSGLEAVRKVAQRNYDLIFMDVRMAEMDGLEATRRIRAMAPDKASVRIVAMTAGALTTDEEACREAGMDDFVSKPVNRKKLLAALEKAAI